MDLTRALQARRLDAFSPPPWVAELGLAPLVKVKATSAEPMARYLASCVPDYSGSECVAALVATITRGHKLLDVRCKRCGRTLVDVGEHAVKPRKVRQCPGCGERTSVAERGHANPLSVLGPVLRGMTLGFA